MTGHTIILGGAASRALAKRLIDAAPMNAVCKVKKEVRTVPQNEKMWSMLTDLAMAKPEGRSWTPETWKCAFMHALGHQILFCEGLDDSGPFPLGFRSSKMTKAQMSDMIEYMYEYGTRNGVQFHETRT
jgi:hypothetical protein